MRQQPIKKMTSLYVLILVAVVGCINAEVVFPSPNEGEHDSDYWYDLGRNELKEALERPKITGVAKNVILFLGDGMGITVSTAGRIYKGQKQGHSGEEGYLVWERFPNMGLMKTYNLDRQVPDSGATATAFLSGVKANYYTIGVNGNVKLNDCEASLKEENRVRSVLEWAQDAGKETGVVTTARITHASPSGLYAKTGNRKWECDTKMYQYIGEDTECIDIARQLVENDPGKKMKVIIGGGRQAMGAPKMEDIEDDCVRGDGRNLVEEWKKDKAAQGVSHAYATTTRELRSIDIDNTEYIMGLFGDLHMDYEVDRNTSLDGTPHIKEMVHFAIQRLQKSDNGFFLMVEGARIDCALHAVKPKRALEELVAMEEAVEMALKMVDLEETLLIVTADHSHVMTINGYPDRGNHILGTTYNYDDISDGLPFTTLMFTTGPGFNFTWNGKEVVRRNLTGIDTKDKDFESHSGVPAYFESETHGGQDIAAFATGPMSHLFHRVHEQSYVAHVMGYAACIGPYEDCDRPARVPKNAYSPIRPKRTGASAGGSSLNTASYSGVFLLLVIHIFKAFSC